MPKYLIVTADDYGVCPSVNCACIEALKRGCVTSLTIMPPVPFFNEAAQLAYKNNIRHVGVHLTLTSEFPNLRWGPVCPVKKVPSLVDNNGFFWPTIELFSKNVKTEDVLLELENQIKKVIRYNIRPTHLDCHMFALHYEVSKRKDFLPVIYYLCKKYKLPFRSPFEKEATFLQRRKIEVLTNSFKETYDILARNKFSTYNKMLRNIRNGISELILHCGYTTNELQTITKRSLRRQRDFDYAVSKETRDTIKKNDILLLSWREATSRRSYFH